MYSLSRSMMPSCEPNTVRVENCSPVRPSVLTTGSRSPLARRAEPAEQDQPRLDSRVDAAAFGGMA